MSESYKKIHTSREQMIAILGGFDTPYVRAFKELRNWKSYQLFKEVADACVDRLSLPAEQLGAVYGGCVVHDPEVPNPARTAVQESLLLPDTLVAETLNENCISGMSAIVAGAQAIYATRVRGHGPKLVLAGGADSASNGCIMFSKGRQRYFRDLMATPKGMSQNLKKLRHPWFSTGHPPSPKEPTTGLEMGEHCEVSVQEFGISRDDQDAYAVTSHSKAVAASKYTSAFVTPLGGYTSHPQPRGDTSLDLISKYEPRYDKSADGTITKAHTGLLTDGASIVALAEPSYAETLGVPVRSYLVDYERVAMDTSMGLLMAPAVAMPRLLSRLQLKFEDFDRIEVHEAFAGQVLSNLHVWERGWKRASVEAIGPLPMEKLNAWGGSIAYGHPFAATAARISNFLTHGLHGLANELGRPTLGLGSVCAAGTEAYVWAQMSFPDE